MITKVMIQSLQNPPVYPSENLLKIAVMQQSTYFGELSIKTYKTIGFLRVDNISPTAPDFFRNRFFYSTVFLFISLQHSCFLILR